jgi:hypothetical protein
MQNITVLDLSYNEISDQGIKYLVDALQNNRVIYINFHRVINLCIHFSRH